MSLLDPKGVDEFEVDDSGETKTATAKAARSATASGAWSPTKRQNRWRAAIRKAEKG